MSWKVSILTIALFGLMASGLAALGLYFPGGDAGPQHPAPMVAAEAVVPPAASAPTDKELIEKQKTCPVSGQPLGSMGKPVKLIYKGRTVLLCCAGCEKPFWADPDKYLKKLDEQK